MNVNVLSVPVLTLQLKSQSTQGRELSLLATHTRSVLTGGAGKDFSTVTALRMGRKFTKL